MYYPDEDYMTNDFNVSGGFNTPVGNVVFSGGNNSIPTYGGGVYGQTGGVLYPTTQPFPYQHQNGGFQLSSGMLVLLAVAAFLILKK